jgi:hypothetical protein
LILTTTYDLSGLVQIVLSDDLHRNVSESVTNQLAGLNPQANSPAKYTLALKPYQSLRRDISQNVGGPADESAENIIEFPELHFAAEFSSAKLTLYLDISGVPLNPWLQLLLVPQGVSMIHAAAVEKDGKSLLLPAFGGAGKTLATGLLVRDYGYKFLGDDIVMLTSDGAVLPFPRPLFFYDHHLDIFGDFFDRRKSTVTQQRLVGNIKRKIVRAMPLKNLVKGIASSLGAEGALRRAAATREYLDAGSASDVFGANRLGEGAPLGKIVFLQRYTGSKLELRSLPTKTLVARAFAILMNEWKAEWPQIVAAGGYGATDLSDHYEQFTAILRSSVANIASSTLMIPKAATPHEYVPMLLDQ